MSSKCLMYVQFTSYIYGVELQDGIFQVVAWRKETSKPTGKQHQFNLTI